MWKTVLVGTTLAVVLTTGIGAVAIGATSSPRPEAPSAIAAAAQDDTVVIEDGRFQPPVIRVEPGATVTWVNRDRAPHNVVAEDGSWESPVLKKGESFSLTFSEGETVRYLCTLHPWMTGVVLVGDDEAPAAAPTTRGPEDMWRHMEEMHGSESIEAMRQHMEAVHGEDAFDAMLQYMQDGQHCGFGGPDEAGGGTTGGGSRGGMMGGGTMGGGYSGGMMGGGYGSNMMGGGTMGW